ncbi:MAG TPA: phospholipase [Planctomycetaceae bacterium]|nr:phospholipase [Planctomycetaceae bacterium]
MNQNVFAIVLLTLVSPGLVAGESIPGEPVPGTQAVQQIELPANTSKRKTKEEQAAEKAQQDALPPQQRAAVRRLQYQERFRPKPLDRTEKETVSYWLFLPADYVPKGGKKWPLLLFLHGMGECGSDPEKVKKHGPPKLLGDPEKAKEWPFITVSPQCPDGYSWSPMQLVLLLERLEKKYAIDKNREYVTGLSMGGGGTWDMLYLFPDRFAAGIPICGYCRPDAAERLRHLPIWAFHGEQDTTSQPENSTKIVEAIRKTGGRQIALTLYPDLAHDCWTVTYDNPEVYQWLLKHKRSNRSSRR